MTELPPGWALSTVGEVGDLRLGKQRSPKWHSGPNMRPYLRVANVFEDRIDISDVKSMHFEPHEVETFELRPGDVLLNEGQSPELLGRPAIYRGELSGACFTNSLIRFRPHTGVLSKWALTIFRHHMHSGRFQRESRITTNIAHLSLGRLAPVEFPVPPTAEQERIIAAVEQEYSRIDAGVRSLNAARAALPALRRSVLSLAVASGEKVHLGELLSDIEAGKSFKTDGRRALADEWAVIKVSAMTWGRFLEDENKALPRGTRFDQRFEIRSGDVLLSRANTSDYVGATVYVERCRPRLLLSDKSMRLHPTAAVDRRWLTHALNSPTVRHQMSSVATGTSDSMRNISQEKVKRLELRAPSIEDQRVRAAEIDRQLTLIDALVGGLRDGLSRSALLRRSILDWAVLGKLVPQDRKDEPAWVLLERIAVDLAADPKPRQRKRA